MTRSSRLARCASDYDVAATIDVLDALGFADPR